MRLLLLICLSTTALAVTPAPTVKTSLPARGGLVKQNGADKVPRKKSGGVPPYAVSMEPLVKYSQPDPLYGEEKTATSKLKKQDSKKSSHVRVKKDDGNSESVIGYTPRISPKTGYASPYEDGGLETTQYHHLGFTGQGAYYDHHHYQEPEPIIEIIIKESNQSLPAPPPPPPPKKKKKEPVQVFYVKYKKEPSSHYGEEKVVYEPPIPAITPPTNNDHHEEEEPEEYHHVEPVTLPPRPSTTLKAIIRPDSETYHGSGIHITFGGPKDEELEHHQDHHSVGGYEEQSAPQPSVLLAPKSKVNTLAKPTSDSQLTKRNPAPFHSQAQSPQQAFHSGAPFAAPTEYYRPTAGPVFHNTPRFSAQPHPFTPQLPNVGPSLPPSPPSSGSSRSSSSLRYTTLPHFPSFPKSQSNFVFPESSPPSHPPPGTQQIFSINQPHLKSSFSISSRSTPQPYQTISNRVTQQPFSKIQSAPSNAPISSFQSLSKPFSQPSRSFSKSSNSFSQTSNSFTQPSPLFSQSSFSHSQKGSVLDLRSQNPSPLPPQAQRHHHLQSQQQFNLDQLKQQQHHQQIEQFNLQQRQQEAERQRQQQFEQQRQQQIEQQRQQQLEQKRQQQIEQQRQQQLEQKRQQQIEQQRQQQIEQQRQQQIEQQRQQQLEQQRQQQIEQQRLQQLEQRHQHQREQIEQLQRQQKHQTEQLQRQQFEQQYRSQQVEQFRQQQQENQQRSQVQTSQSYQKENFGTPPSVESTYAPEIIKSISAEFPFESSHRFDAKTLLQSTTKPQQYVHQNIQPTTRGHFIQKEEPTSRPQFVHNTQAPSRTQYVQSVPSTSRPNYIQSSHLNTQRYTVAKTLGTTTQVYKKYTETTQPPIEYITQDPVKAEEERRKKEERRKQNVAALPEEVPEDLRKQLLSSDILGNADIQILDYDKIGDIPIDKLPPEALANFQAIAGSAPVPAVVKPDRTSDDVVAEGSEQHGVAVAAPSDVMEMKVVRYNPESHEGAQLASQYMKDGATQLEPVVLNDSRYNRYLPLKVSGAQFPVPDVPELRGKNVTSVVVLAPVDYEFLQRQDPVDDGRTGRSSHPVLEVQGVHFVTGDILKTLVKRPTLENYRLWLEKENNTAVDKQSVVLLVIELKHNETANAPKEIYMYDIGTQKVNKLSGELSAQFVEVAESNSENDDLEEISDSQQGSFTVKEASEVSAPSGQGRRQRDVAGEKNDNLGKSALPVSPR